MALVFRDIPDPAGGLSRRGGVVRDKRVRPPEETAVMLSEVLLRRDFTARAAALPHHEKIHHDGAGRSRAGY